MNMVKQKQLIIAGLGPAGLTAASFFASRGWIVRGYEKSPEPTGTTPVTDTRGYGFTFSPRGLSCLPEELKHLVQGECHPISERVFVYNDGSRRTYPYGWKDHDKLHSLSRLHFLTLAKKVAVNSGAELHFSTHITDVNAIEGKVTFRGNCGGEKEDQADLILGADGAFSVARTRVSAVSGSSFSVHFDGVRFITVALTQEEVNRLTDNPVGLHFFMSPKGTDVFIPTPPKGTLLIMSHLLPGMGKLTKNVAISICATRNRAVKDAIPDLAERIVGSTVGHFVTTEMEKPYASKCVIVGDAWKAMPAYAGQGVNAAVQDVNDLVRMIDTHPTIEVAVALFAQHRHKQRKKLNFLNKSIGRNLLNGTYGNLWWRAKERLRKTFRLRSPYQRLAFDQTNDP